MAEENIQAQEASAPEQSLEQLISGNAAYQEQYKAMVEQNRKAWQQEAAAEKSEAEKLAGMSTAQRERFLFEKEKQEFDQQRADFERRQLTLQMGAELQRRGFSSEMAPWITGKDAEQSMKNLNAFEEAFKAEVQRDRMSVMRGAATPSQPKSKAADLSDAFLQGFNS